MSPKKKASKATKKNRKRKTRQTKPQPKLKQVSLTLGETRAATAADPLGACQYTDDSGQIVCIDKVTKTQCSKFKTSIFLAGESCH
jgi:hypothetical protein